MPGRSKSFRTHPVLPISVDMCSSARLRSLLTVCLLVLAACGGAQRDEAGSIIEAGSEDVFALQVGDCFDDPSEFGEIASVDAVPCAQPHDNEIYHMFDLPDGVFPGDVAIDEAAFDRCLPAFESYVGTTYESSSLDISYLSPTLDSWDAGDREIACLLYDLNLQKLTGSMEGSQA